MYATKAVLESQANALFALYLRHGIDPAYWALRHGSKTYGLEYKIVQVDPETGGESVLLRLGLTKREASERICGAIAALGLLRG
ncbi:MAG: hypothetical protein ACRCSN_04800 [Dermatophilaceae bacterium]